MANNALIGGLRAEATLESGKFVDGAKKIRTESKKTQAQLKTSFGGMSDTLKGFGRSLVAGLSIGLFGGMIKKGLEYAGSLGEVAQQLGVTTRELQTFRFAAQQNGASLEQADQALGKFAISISKALSGSKQTAEAFKAVGVSLADLQSKSRTEIIGQIADQMKATGGASANAAAGVAIFGKGFLKIAPTLDMGSKGMTELSAAAERLGIVLSDEQIQKADETADKLDAIQTVLSAQIAGTVADNANSILQLAEALIQIANALAVARSEIVKFQLRGNNLMPWTSDKKRAANRAGIFRENLNIMEATGAIVARSMEGATKTRPRGTLPSFLAGGGGRGGRGGDPNRERKEAMRDAFQFDQELRRADMDILRAKQSLAHDYVDRTAISIELLNLEKAGFEAEQAYQIALYELTKGEEGMSAAQAALLAAKYDQRDAAERQAVLEQEQADRQADYNRLEAVDFELKRAELDRERDLTTTSAERRDVELRILDLAYREERERLQRIIDESKDWAEIEEARRRMLALSQSQSADRKIVLRNTAGPYEDWLASLPTTAEKMQEAFEQLQVQGFEGLIDSALALTEGLDDAGEALLNTLKQFFLGMARAQLQSALGSILPKSGFNLGSIFGAASGTFGGGISESGAITVTGLPTTLPGFASGGSMVLRGIPGIDKNLISMNGIPIARANYGERLHFDPANERTGSSQGRPLVQNFNFPNSDADSFRRSEGQVARAARRRLAI